MLLAVIDLYGVHMLRWLAVEYVRRLGGLELGRPVAGVFVTIAVNEAADLGAIRAELVADQAEGPVGGGGDGSGQGGGGGGAGPTAGGGAGAGSDDLRARLAVAGADRAIDAFRGDLR